MDREHERSPLWPARERAHLLVQPCCLVCGRHHCQVKTNVHHKYPFHVVVALGRPDLELDERNLYTMCVDSADQHHLTVGHLGSFESYNPDLEHWIAMTRGLLASQIRAMADWVDAVKLRPRPLPKMTTREKSRLRDQLDQLFPEIPLHESVRLGSIHVPQGGLHYAPRHD